MNNERKTHIDLFSGIGGFALAARWNKIETICFCEIDPQLQDFLRKKYSGIPVFGDIREFPTSEFRGAFLLTAGIPCQPVSCAGKRRGTEDDRWLWPEALRIVSEARPDWVVFENPPGIRTLGLDGILSEMESLGYATVTIDIPAASVGSPQKRRRYFIVANSGRKRFKELYVQQILPEKKETRFSSIEPFLLPDWPPRPGAQHRIPKMADGVSRGLLSALGNSIVPQVAAEIIRAVIQAEKFTEGLTDKRDED